MSLSKNWTMRISEQLRGNNSVLSGNFLVLLLTWVLMYSTQPIADTYSSLYFLNLGASPFVLSVMFFTGSLAIAFVQFPGGYLADKHGRKRLISTMSFGLALGYLFFIFAPSWEFIVLGMVLQNLCLIYMPAMMALMIDSLDPNKRGTGFNFQSVFVNLISLPAPLLAASLVLVNGEYRAPQSNVGMRVAYAIVFVAYLIAAFLRVKLKETLGSTDKNSHPRFLQAFRKYPAVVKESWYVWGKVPMSAFYLFLTTIGINSLVAACHIYFVVYATEILKISGSEYAWVIALMYLSIAIPSILAGFKMDSVGRKQFLILGYILYIPSMFMFVVATNFYLMFTAFFLFGLGNILRVNSSQVLLGDLIPRELRGKAVGFLQFFLYVTQAMVYLLMGFLYEYVAPWLPFVLLAIAAAPFGLLATLKISEPKTKEI
ncbi:MAG: MFS transporter [Candidatus Bathyarchaeota archaeon]|nr:MFS transporter [Candidatus Bathyarchaeota archaeon]